MWSKVWKRFIIRPVQTCSFEVIQTQKCLELFRNKYNPMFRLPEISLLNNVCCEEYGKSFGVTNPSCHALFLRMLAGSFSLRKKRDKWLFFFSRNVEFHSFSKRVSFDSATNLPVQIFRATWRGKGLSCCVSNLTVLVTRQLALYIFQLLFVAWRIAN